MAKTIQYKVDINTSRAEEELQDLNNQLDDIQEKSKVDLLIDSSQSVKSVGDVRKAYRALRDAQIEVGEGTEEFNRLGAAAAGLKDRLDAVNEVAQDLGGSTLERFRNSLGRIKEGIVNLDLDKVRQGFTQLSTTFTGLTQGLTKGQIAARAFGAALAATGIGLFIAAIATLISNFDTIKESGGVIGNTFKAIGQIFETVRVSVLKLSDAIGLTSSAYDTYLTKQNEATEANKKELKSVEDLRRALFDKRKELGDTNAQEEEDERIKRAKADAQKDINDLEAEAVRINEELNKARQESIRLSEEQVGGLAGPRQGIQGISTLTEVYNNLTQAQKDFIDGLVQEQIQNRKNNTTQAISLENQLKLFDIYQKSPFAGKLIVDNLVEQALAQENINKLTKEQEENVKKLTLAQGIRGLAGEADPEVAKKAAEDAAAAENKRKKAAEDAFNARLEQIRLEGEINQEDLAEREEFAKQFFDKEGQLFKDAEDAKKALRDKTKADVIQATNDLISEAERKIEAEKKLEEELTRFKEQQEEAKRQAIQATFNGALSLTSAVSGLVSQLYANEIADAEGNFERQEELREESFEANKALQIASTVITTAQAVMNGLNAGLQIGGPWGIALGAITAAAAAATGAVQIATIEATRYQPSGGSTPSITAPSPTTPASVTPNVTFAGGTAGFNQTGGGSNQMNINASISVNEINSVQNQVAVYETGAIIGGGG